MSSNSGAKAFLNDFNGKVFRMWKYKRMFTPREQEHKYIDQSEFVDDECEFVFINGFYNMCGKTFVDYTPIYMEKNEENDNEYHEFEDIDYIHLAFSKNDTKSYENGEL